MKKFYNCGVATVSFILWFSALLLLFDFPKVDDIPYQETVQSIRAGYQEFRDTNSVHDNVEENALKFDGGDEAKVFTKTVSLEGKDYYLVRFDANNLSDESARINVDLHASYYDYNYVEFSTEIKPGENHVKGVLPFYRGEHPKDALLRIFSYDSSPMEVYNIEIVSQKNVVDQSNLVKLAEFSCLFVLFITSVLLCYNLFLYNMSRKRNIIPLKSINEERKWNLLCIGTLIVAITLILAVLYRKANIFYPLVYSNGDEMGIYYIAKNIRENGLTLVNPWSGGLSGADMFDYPYSDKLSFIFVKIISLFTSEVYLTVNLLYFLNHYLIAFASFYVCQKLKISKPVSMLISILYTFTFYIQLRYGHMWLIAYYMIPLMTLVAIKIYDGTIWDKTAKIRDRKQFWEMILIAFFSAFTGMYYAYFACALFAVMMVIRIVNCEKSKIGKELFPTYFILSTLFGVFVNIVPNILYWQLNGQNPINEMQMRLGAEAEEYGLKFVQMILPRLGHRVGFLAETASRYYNNYPLVNENVSASMGVVASIGLIVSMFLLFSRKKEYKVYSYINTAVFVIATVGGVGSVLSVFVKIPMRAYNRMSLIIMFTSLVLVGLLIEKYQKKLSITVIAVSCILITLIGLADQTTDYQPPDYSSFESTVSLIDEIENTLEKGDMVLQLPYANWPTSATYRQHMGYIESENIHWSYGSMQGREEAVWQSSLVQNEPSIMIKLAKDAGYDGIYFDTGLYIDLFGVDKMQEYSNGITREMGFSPMVSSDGKTYFWDIR